MTLFRHALTTKTRLDLEREQETACGSTGQGANRQPRFSRSAYRRYAFRNHLRSRLRQKLGRQ